MIMHNGDEHFIPCTGTSQSAGVERENASRAYQTIRNIRPLFLLNQLVRVVRTKGLRILKSIVV